MHPPAGPTCVGRDRRPIENRPCRRFQWWNPETRVTVAGGSHAIR